MTSPAHIPSKFLSPLSPEARAVREDFHAVTAAGVTVGTFADKDLAVAWVKARRATHPGMTVQHVVVTETRRCAYRPRPVLVRDHDLSIPERPAA